MVTLNLFYNAVTDSSNVINEINKTNETIINALKSDKLVLNIAFRTILIITILSMIMFLVEIYRTDNPFYCFVFAYLVAINLLTWHVVHTVNFIIRNMMRYVCNNWELGDTQNPLNNIV